MPCDASFLTSSDKPAYSVSILSPTLLHLLLSHTSFSPFSHTTTSPPFPHSLLLSQAKEKEREKQAARPGKRPLNIDNVTRYTSVHGTSVKRAKGSHGYVCRYCL